MNFSTACRGVLHCAKYSFIFCFVYECHALLRNINYTCTETDRKVSAFYYEYITHKINKPPKNGKFISITEFKDMMNKRKEDEIKMDKFIDNFNNFNVIVYNYVMLFAKRLFIFMTSLYITSKTIEYLKKCRSSIAYIDPDNGNIGKGIDPDNGNIGKGIDPDNGNIGKGIDPDNGNIGKSLKND